MVKDLITIQDNEDDGGFWEPIVEGNRGPVEIIYLAIADVDLVEIEEWGELTGFWTIRVVRSVDEAIREHEVVRADLMILLGVSIDEARRIARQFPELPLSIAKFGGWEGFPSGWPEQVVVAQWAAPRPGEFQDSVASALNKVSTRIIYEAQPPRIEIFSAVSEELLARLAQFPEKRFDLDPRVFEETVAELLARMGYAVQLTPRSADEGRDVIASIGTPVAPLLMLVECKRFAQHRLVGPEPIARLWFRLFDDRANMAMVVTTSGFQRVAKETARSRGYQISLKDGDDFIRWVRSQLRQ